MVQSSNETEEIYPFGKSQKPFLALLIVSEICFLRIFITK